MSRSRRNANSFTKNKSCYYQDRVDADDDDDTDVDSDFIDNGEEEEFSSREGSTSGESSDDAAEGGGSQSLTEDCSQPITASKSAKLNRKNNQISSSSSEEDDDDGEIVISRSRKRRKKETPGRRNGETSKKKLFVDSEGEENRVQNGEEDVRKSSRLRAREQNPGEKFNRLRELKKTKSRNTSSSESDNSRMNAVPSPPANGIAISSDEEDQSPNSDNRNQTGTTQQNGANSPLPNEVEVVTDDQNDVQEEEIITNSSTAPVASSPIASVPNDFVPCSSPVQQEPDRGRTPSPQPGPSRPRIRRVSTPQSVDLTNADIFDADGEEPGPSNRTATPLEVDWSDIFDKTGGPDDGWIPNVPPGRIRKPPVVPTRVDDGQTYLNPPQVVRDEVPVPENLEANPEPEEDPWEVDAIHRRWYYLRAVRFSNRDIPFCYEFELENGEEVCIRFETYPATIINHLRYKDTSCHVLLLAEVVAVSEIRALFLDQFRISMPLDVTGGIGYQQHQMDPQLVDFAAAAGSSYRM